MLPAKGFAEIGVALVVEENIDDGRGMASVRILIADDHEVVRRGLRSLLSARPEWHVCGEAVDGTDAVQKTKALKPDVLVLDVTMPHLNGLEAARLIRRDVPETEILILSQHGAEEMRQAALNAGARAYVTKSDISRDLMVAVDALSQHQSPPLPEVHRQQNVIPSTPAPEFKSHVDSLADGSETEALLRSQALSARLLQLQDDEKRWIARRLHDSAGQMLAALSMNLGSIQKEAGQLSSRASDVFAESLALVGETSAELRNLSQLLHPPMLDEAGLASAVRWYAEKFTADSKIPVQLELAPDLGRLAKKSETAIFRVVQESLANIERHSESSTAAIHITLEDQAVRVEVRDQGKGMPTGSVGDSAQPAKTGFGIQAMQERVRQLGGSLAIRSDKHGTVVSALVPV